MAAELTSPVPFSTPENHILTETDYPVARGTDFSTLPDDEFCVQYEIERTLHEIRSNRWSRVALQFPDSMLGDSVRVYQMLARGYKSKISTTKSSAPVSVDEIDNVNNLVSDVSILSVQEDTEQLPSLKLTILADTSYGSCCVDEIAAEHVDADVVVHYGRTCLSPTSRLPVLYVYTKRALNHEMVVQAFARTFLDKTEKIIMMADVPYSYHVDQICEILRSGQGYENVHAANIVRDNGALIPNRTLPKDIGTAQDESSSKEKLKSWNVFHISDPPTALLLTLESRVKAVHIFSTESQSSTSAPRATQTNTAQVLRRRYALITSLNTVPTWGILINTLSVKNYLHVVDHVKQQIAEAGKKSYLFVVGKLNPAKVANFAEIGGWIVIGCWESSLIDSRDFYRPIITPFELTIVLKSDEERVWTGEWRSDFQGVLDQAGQWTKLAGSTRHRSMPGAFLEDDELEQSDTANCDSDEESAPPEFDLRTGKYISKTRPMRNPQYRSSPQSNDTLQSSTALTKRANGDILVVNGVASPAAEFLAQKRTWRGLGSDFEIKYDEEETEQGGLIEEGRTGIARGYTVGDSERR